MTEEDEGLELPAAITRRLRERDASRAPVPPLVEARILSRARASLAPARRGARFRRWAVPAALAASVLLAAVLIGPDSPDISRPDSARIASGDLDGSGRVDVLDVLLLARLREQGDARVSERDVEALATRIVSLGGDPS